jgi:hypothetical protein
MPYDGYGNMTRSRVILVLTMVTVAVILLAGHQTFAADTSTLTCGGGGYAPWMDTNRVDLMASQWVTPPTGSFTIE